MTHLARNISKEVSGAWPAGFCCFLHNTTQHKASLRGLARESAAPVSLCPRSSLNLVSLCLVHPGFWHFLVSSPVSLVHVLLLVSSLSFSFTSLFLLLLFSLFFTFLSSPFLSISSTISWFLSVSRSFHSTHSFCQHLRVLGGRGAPFAAYRRVWMQRGRGAATGTGGDGRAGW